VRAVQRRYRDGTLVLETEFETDDGAVALIDCMPPRTELPALIRVVEGRRGRVPMRLELTIRLAYGSLIPWVRRDDDGIVAVGGPDALRLQTPVELRGEDFQTVADFAVSAGQRVPFTLSWFPSHRPEPAALNALDAVETTTRWWQEWSGRCSFAGPWREAVVRSLITLKALTYARDLGRRVLRLRRQIRRVPPSGDPQASRGGRSARACPADHGDSVHVPGPSRQFEGSRASRPRQEARDADASGAMAGARNQGPVGRSQAATGA
jgi:hypothetical protein